MQYDILTSLQSRLCALQLKLGVRVPLFLDRITNEAVCVSNGDQDQEQSKEVTSTSTHKASVIKLQKHMIETTSNKNFYDWMDILFSKINIYNLMIIERSTKLLEVLQSFCMGRP